MTEVITAIKRDALGTSASRRLRKEGKIPAIIYGENREPIHIAVDQNKIFHAINREEFHTNMIHLELNNQSFQVIVRAFQMHPFKPMVLHVDFQIVEPNKPIKIKVPLKFLNGESSIAVKLHGGSIFKITNSIEILALPEAIPQHLQIDLKNISAGQIIHASDIDLPQGVELVTLRRGDNPPIVSASGKSK